VSPEIISVLTVICNLSILKKRLSEGVDISAPCASVMLKDTAIGNLGCHLIVDIGWRCHNGVYPNHTRNCDGAYKAALPKESA
jgi:hypothetical protein